MARVNSGDLNLQPDFQRGEVWGPPKKRRLIDSILREWHVPPVHVIVDPKSELLEVLDGQQRLAAIRDFFNDELSVDGNFKPFDKSIAELDKLVFSQLPLVVKRRFENYTIRIIRIEDFTPEEPGELFYRLNQPTNLTSAEQRNAFYGPSRRQVKDLVARFEEYGLDYSVLGFKNARMAYDDIVAKVCCCLHHGDLNTKITAGLLTEHYRSTEPFHDLAVERTDFSLNLLGRLLSLTSDIKFNKATLFSWLIFLSQFSKVKTLPPAGELASFLSRFESFRQSTRGRRHNWHELGADFSAIGGETLIYLFNQFNDRASSRVADVSSVIMRDFILWLTYSAYGAEDENRSNDAPAKAETAYQSLPDIRYLVGENADSDKLGELLFGLNWGYEL